MDKVEISSLSDKQVTVKLSFKQIATPEDADSIERLNAEQVADRLAFEYKVSAGDPAADSQSALGMFATVAKRRKG